MKSAFTDNEVVMRHIDATVVDQTHLRVHPPLAMPVGAVVRLAIVVSDAKSSPMRRKGVRAKRLPLGMDEGKGKIHESFFKPLPRDVLDSFYGKTA